MRLATSAGTAAMSPAPEGARPPERFPFWGLLAVPGGIVFGALGGILLGALFGIPGIGAAIGAGLGIGIGLALLAAAIVIASART